MTKYSGSKRWALAFALWLELIGHESQLWERFGSHFSHHIPSMNFDRYLGDADVRRDLLIEAPPNHEGHNFALSSRQRVEPLSQSEQRLIILASRAILGEARLNRIEQILISKWLRQKFNRPSLHGLDGHRNIAMRRDEDYGQRDLRHDELTLKIEAALPG
jgi:hypothetical protein